MIESLSLILKVVAMEDYFHPGNKVKQNELFDL